MLSKKNDTVKEVRQVYTNLKGFPTETPDSPATFSIFDTSKRLCDIYMYIYIKNSFKICISVSLNFRKFQQQWREFFILIYWFSSFKAACALIRSACCSSSQSVSHSPQAALAFTSLNVFKCFSIPGLIRELFQVCLRVAFKLIGPNSRTWTRWPRLCSYWLSIWNHVCALIVISKAHDQIILFFLSIKW